MKKIGIITLNGYINYGNRLQNYAVQEVLRKLNYNSETIIVKNIKKNASKKNSLQNKFNKIVQMKFIDIFLRIKQKISNCIYKKIKLEVENLKIKNFIKFTKIHLKETCFYISDDNIPKNISEKYDYFLTGSDQVWNPKFNGESGIYFLNFVSPEKSISFSASFGLEQIPVKINKKYIEWLNGLKYISVREVSGKKIVEELTNKEAVVLLDPTMTLEKKDWLEFKEVCDIKPKNKYILTYFLGEISEKANKILANYKKEGYAIVKLNSFNMPAYYAINPSEWVDFVNDASLFLTDSFHGVAFAHILKTPFVVYNRIGGEGMSSRITTILKKFNTEDRFELDINSKKLFEMNFTGVDKILETERKRTYDFLKNALGDN